MFRPPRAIGMGVTLLHVMFLVVGAMAGLMARDRGRLSRRLVSATRAIQLEELRRLGCTYGQGYLFSRPVEAAEFGELLGRSLLPMAV